MNWSTVIPHHSAREPHVSPSAAMMGYVQERLVMERHEASEASKRPAARWRTTMVKRAAKMRGLGDKVRAAMCLAVAWELDALEPKCRPERGAVLSESFR